METVAEALGDLCDELVFVGGCAAGLLYTSPTAPPPRVTYDVDLVAEVAAIPAYHALEARLLAHGLSRDTSEDAPICRWCIGDVQVDVMPTDERVLGFSNRWYPLVITTASTLRLPGGSTIRLIAAPVFLATKFEAFATRGRGDLLASHDFEDIIGLLDGRPELEDEITGTTGELANYLASRFRDIAGHPDFENTLPGLVSYDALYEERILAVRRRITAIASRDTQ